MTPSRATITGLLRAWGGGDARAAEVLLPLVYGELKRMAAHYLRGERPDHRLEPAALVHEAYLRLVRHGTVAWRSREHFFGLAARAMREVLIDRARARRRKKRGDGAVRVDFEHVGLLPPQRHAALIALDDALAELARLDPPKAATVELHFFAGFTVRETARLLGCSTATVTRRWRMAKDWLARWVGRPSAR